MPYDLIIFDCDGVLIDSEWLANQVEIEELDQLGYSISMEHYLDVALGRPNDAVEQQLLAHYGWQLPAGYWQHVRERQEKEFRAKLTPIPGVQEGLKNLAIPCCVASGSSMARLTTTLNITGLFPYLEGRVFGRECVKRGKPDPDIFLYAARQMDVAPARCLVIEDSLHGIDAAHAAGMDVWGFCGGRHFTPKRKEQFVHLSSSHIFEDMQLIFDQLN